MGMVLFSLLCVAFFTLLERQLLASSQARLGPKKVLLGGVGQPICDALKLLSKKDSSTESANSFLFFVGPFTMMFSSMVVWWAFPSKWGVLFTESSVLFVLLVVSMSVFGIHYTGWLSKSKYGVLGVVRATVQSISYEVGFALSVVFCCLFMGSTYLSNWSEVHRFLPLGMWSPVLLLCVVVVVLVEVNRSPFDLSEGESELVSGFCVEFGGGGYTLVFMAETLALLWASVILNKMFLGMVMGEVFMLVGLILIRACIPRMRIDCLVSGLWEVLLPLLLSMCMIYISMIYLLGWPLLMV